MELEGKKVIVLAEDLYNEVELWYPYYRLREAGAQVTLVGTGSAQTYHSKVGLPVTVDAEVGNIKAKDYDGILIPGGFAPDRMRRHTNLLDLVRQMHEANKPVAAICHAGWVLASAGILRGKQVTSYDAIKDDVINAGAEWHDRELVVDNNLITSRKPDDLPAFMRAFVEALSH